MTLAEFAEKYGIPHDDRKPISKASQKMISPMLERADKAIQEAEKIGNAGWKRKFRSKK